jgi:hypothetical protein
VRTIFGGSPASLLHDGTGSRTTLFAVCIAGRASGTIRIETDMRSRGA